jgi:hypothetical protein
MSADDNDEVLLTRLRDLSLVELDALLAGSAGPQRAQLLGSYAEDLCDALQAARERCRELLQVIAAGPDPLNLLDASHEARAREGGREAGDRVARRLAARADACRTLARLDDFTAQLVPRLLDADRHQVSL